MGCTTCRLAHSPVDRQFSSMRFDCIRWLSLLMVASILLLPALPSQAQTFEDGLGPVDVTNTQEIDPKSTQRGSSNSERHRSPQGQTFQPQTGRKAAEKYMAVPARRGIAEADSDESETVSQTAARSRSNADDHYLAIHLGTYVSDTAFKWGDQDSAEDVGRWTLGVTYRVGEWVNSMDLAIRVDLNTYSLSEGRTSKLSFLPLVIFPDANSRFPLYFGIGAGLGVFVSQIGKESSLAIDYQLIAGVRFLDIFGNTGFFVEAGLKNSLFFLSDGQFNGTYVSVGSVFVF